MAGSAIEHSFYAANFVNAILYGIELVLYFQLIRLLLGLQKRTRMDVFLIVFSTVLLVLNTIFWVSQVWLGDLAWIVHPGYPGGAEAYLYANTSVWYQLWGTAASVACNLMNDALLIYRCFVIWNSIRAAILPALLWVASLVFGGGLLYTTAAPGGNYFAGLATVFVTAYTASTFAFNVLASALICARILWVGRAMRRAGYPADEGRVYTGAVSIVVESALPFTVFSFVYLVAYALGSAVAYAFSFYAMFTCISPLMISLRVLSRSAWTRGSATLFSTTISYRGQTDFVTRDSAADPSPDLSRPREMSSPLIGDEEKTGAHACAHKLVSPPGSFASPDGIEGPLGVSSPDVGRLPV